MSVMRSPRDVFASKFAARVLKSSVTKAARCHSAPNRAASGPDVPHMSFCKRSVPVASCSVELRSLAFAYCTSPKDALSRAFSKSRRAARTNLLLRMSERLAGPSSRSAVMSKLRLQKLRSGAWRPLHSVVSDVLREAQGAAKPIPRQDRPEAPRKH